eukprot:313197-Pleurochrysis_carterae.AAC.1
MSVPRKCRWASRGREDPWSCEDVGRQLEVGGHTHVVVHVCVAGHPGAARVLSQVGLESIHVNANDAVEAERRRERRDNQRD